MNENEIEIGLLKARIDQEINYLRNDRYLDRIKENIKNDDNVERLKKVLVSLEYFQRKKEKELRMNQREYWNMRKIEMDRDVREMRKKGYKIDDDYIKEYKKDCDKLGRLK